MEINRNILTMVRGDSDTLYVTVKNYELSTGDTVKMSVRNCGKTDRLGRITAGNDLKFTKTATISDKIAVITIEPNDTKNLTENRYVYDVELTTSAGKVHTIVPINYFDLIDEVTR